MKADVAPTVLDVLKKKLFAKSTYNQKGSPWFSFFFAGGGGGVIIVVLSVKIRIPYFGRSMHVFGTKCYFPKPF